MAAPKRHTGSVQEAFGIVLFAVVAIAAVVALIAAAGSGALYRQIGRGGLSLNEGEDRRPSAGGGRAPAERDAEVRQMLTARNARRALRAARRRSTSRPSWSASPRRRSIPRWRPRSASS